MVLSLFQLEFEFDCKVPGVRSKSKVLAPAPPPIFQFMFRTVETAAGAADPRQKKWPSSPRTAFVANFPTMINIKDKSHLITSGGPKQPQSNAAPPRP